MITLWAIILLEEMMPCNCLHYRSYLRLDLLVALNCASTGILSYANILRDKLQLLEQDEIGNWMFSCYLSMEHLTKDDARQKFLLLWTLLIGFRFLSCLQN
uniref:Uncharacterized protein n=1 Tax=Gossypium raimondii TaxID=29730 RepID=A0A0D2SL39_GOSRA|nr:hypothetical protein B456_007G280300 [Gossypium raimondii]